MLKICLLQLWHIGVTRSVPSTIVWYVNLVVSEHEINLWAAVQVFAKYILVSFSHMYHITSEDLEYSFYFYGHIYEILQV